MIRFLIGWCVVSVPAALFVGRCIAYDRHMEDRWHREATPDELAALTGQPVHHCQHNRG